MKRIGIKDFRKNMAMYCKELPVEVMKNGKPWVRVESVKNIVKDPVIEEKPHESVHSLSTKSPETRGFDPIEFSGKYGCGCKKTESYLCPKHSRF